VPALSGIFSVLVGVWMILMPGARALVLVWYFGAYAIASGVLLITLG